MVRRRNLRSERGAALIMFVIFLPVLFAFFSFVVDSGHAFGVKRATQNAADAAALAAAQDLTDVLLDCGSDITCYRAAAGGPPPSTYRQAIAATALDYAQQNGSPVTELKECKDIVSPELKNCYTWPYPERPPGEDLLDDYLRVEVWLQNEALAFFAPIVGKFFGLDGSLEVFQPAARAVASALATLGPCEDFSPANPPNPDCEIPAVDGFCDESITTPDPSGDCEPIPGDDAQIGDLDLGSDSHCIFDPPIEDPDQYLSNDPPCLNPEHVEGGIAGAQAFTMSPSCRAIWYTGAGGGRVGAFATNGGLTFEGNANKKVEVLGFDQPRCGSLLPQPPNGNPVACQASTSQFCVKNLVDLSAQIPINWPVPPPPLPTPLPVGTAWDPTQNYPGNCILLAPVGTGFVITAATRPATPGIYCVSGAAAILDIRDPTTAGDGYTFFALGGARIAINSNGTSVKFYWPSACGPRPTTRSLSFTCFGRTITGYDPLTLIYSTNATPFPATCATSAVCFNGQNGSIDGDIFAPLPNTFPPGFTPPQGGGTVWVAGGSANAGAGFIESWQLVIQGNGGTYTGTGPIVGGTLIPGDLGTLVLGDDATCIFNPPVPDPESYLPDCLYPGADPTFGTWIDPQPAEYGRQPIIGADVGMDE